MRNITELKWDVCSPFACEYYSIHTYTVFCTLNRVDYHTSDMRPDICQAYMQNLACRSRRVVAWSTLHKGGRTAIASLISDSGCLENMGFGFICVGF